MRSCIAADRSPVSISSAVRFRSSAFSIAARPLETLVRRQIPSAFKLKGTMPTGAISEHGFSTLLAGAQRRLRTFAIGDVSADAAVTDEVPRVVKHRQPRTET